LNVIEKTMLTFIQRLLFLITFYTFYYLQLKSKMIKMWFLYVHLKGYLFTRNSLLT